MKTLRKLLLSALIGGAIFYCGFVSGKDDDYAPIDKPMITSVSDQTFQHEVVESLTPVVLDVCTAADCSTRLPDTENLAIHFAGRAKFVQVPDNDNPGFIRRLESRKAVLPVYIVKSGEYIYIGRKAMTDLETREFINSVLSSHS